MYALVDIKGKQYRAEKGVKLKVDRIQNKAGDRIEFDTVLLLSDDDRVEVGTPFVKGIKVKATVEDHVSDKKVTVYKMKKRKGYRRTKGHRQQYTLLTVEDIGK